MKTGTLFTKIVMILLFCAVVGYLVFYAVQSMLHPFQTVLAYHYTVDVVIDASGFLVRDEEPISSDGMIVDVLVTEGEKVSVGQALGIRYQNQAAVERNQEIAALELRLEQLKYALQKEGESMDSLALDRDIVGGILSLHADVAKGTLTSLSTDAQFLKNLIFKRSYAYSGEEGLPLLIDDIAGQIKALRQQSGGESSLITASQSGTFSGFADGYESILTPALLNTLTPSEFDRLPSQKAERGSPDIGKLILGSTWHLAAVLSAEDAARFTVGQGVTLRFPHSLENDLKLTIDRIGEAENGRQVIVFSADRYMMETTLLRHQAFQIVCECYAGLRVPKKALRLSEDGRTGVYCLVGTQSEFKPVSLIFEGEDYYLVQPANEASAKRLHEGDDLILSADDLYGGKVISTS